MVTARGKWSRQAYDDTLKGLHDVVMGVRILRNAGEEIASYTRSEATCNEIIPFLMPDKKSRIVIDYDPASDKVAMYREED